MKNLLVKIIMVTIIICVVALSGCKTANINSEGAKEEMLQNHYVNIISILESSYYNTTRLIDSKEIQSVAKIIVDCK